MANDKVNNVEVLAERIANISKRLDDQVALSKTAVDAALTAIQVAKLDQERTVTVAFAASERANTKTEESQKESNRAIGVLQNDVVSLKESRSQGSGKDSAKTGDKQQFNWAIGLLVPTVLALLAMLYHLAK
jgi:hypothetical protein